MTSLGKKLGYGPASAVLKQTTSFITKLKLNFIYNINILIQNR